VANGRLEGSGVGGYRVRSGYGGFNLLLYKAQNAWGFVRIIREPLYDRLKCELDGYLNSDQEE
jgi:hypothetical protein